MFSKVPMVSIKF
uniref:Uncharacterized protein n=1 Tax=Anguilla anguilla TaxID=7936 RepID=A0A0E9XX77_ANGAN